MQPLPVMMLPPHALRPRLHSIGGLGLAQVEGGGLCKSLGHHSVGKSQYFLLIVYWLDLLQALHGTYHCAQPWHRAICMHAMPCMGWVWIRDSTIFGSA